MKAPKRIAQSMLLVSFVYAGVGCSGDESGVDEPMTSDVQANEKSLPAAKVNDQSNEFSIDAQGNVSFSGEVVYFKFDDHTLTEEGRSRLAIIANYLEKNKSKMIKVQGHSDERGSTEYNLALGQLRTKSVVKFLQDLGIEGKRLSAMSYGEEKPAALGHSEASWVKNRRADFVIKDM